MLLGFDLEWEKTRGELVEEVTFRTEDSEQKEKLPTVTYGIVSPGWQFCQPVFTMGLCRSKVELADAVP